MFNFAPKGILRLGAKPAEHAVGYQCPSFADDVNHQVRYATVARLIGVRKMTPYHGTQAKATGYDFVAHHRQNEGSRLGPKKIIRYMLILP